MLRHEQRNEMQLCGIQKKKTRTSNIHSSMHGQRKYIIREVLCLSIVNYLFKIHNVN